MDTTCLLFGQASDNDSTVVQLKDMQQKVFLLAFKGADLDAMGSCFLHCFVAKLLTSVPRVSFEKEQSI